MEEKCELPPNLSSREEGGYVEQGNTIPVIDDNESDTIFNANEENKDSGNEEYCEDSDNKHEESILVSGRVTLDVDSVDKCEISANNESIEPNSQEITQHVMENKYIALTTLIEEKTADSYNLATEEITDSLNNPAKDEDSIPVSFGVIVEDEPEVGYNGDNDNRVKYSPEILSGLHDEETEENYSLLDDRKDADTIVQENLQSFREKTNAKIYNSDNSGDFISISGSEVIDQESDVEYKGHEQNVITDSTTIPSGLQEQQIENTYAVLEEIGTVTELRKPIILSKDDDESSISSQETPINITVDTIKDDNQDADSSNSSSSTSVKTPTTMTVTSTFGVWDVKPIISSSDEDLVSSEKDDKPVEEKKGKKRNRKRNKALRPQSNEKDNE